MPTCRGRAAGTAPNHLGRIKRTSPSRASFMCMMSSRGLTAASTCWGASGSAQNGWSCETRNAGAGELGAPVTREGAAGAAPEARGELDSHSRPFAVYFPHRRREELVP